MKIRSILTIKYAGITATIFLVFMATIYCVNEHLRSDSFYRSLRSEAITKAHLFLNNQVDVETMQSIYLNNRQFIDEVEVAVYTPDFRILYHDALHNDIIKETPGMIDEIVRKKEIDFRTGDYQGIGILYEFGGKNYVVTAAAYDRYGHINQVIMTRLLLLLSIGGLSVLVIVGYMLAKSSLAPIRSIVRKAEGITVTQYQNSIHNALQDSQRVIELIDGLLNLAKADYYPEQIKKEEIRLDELLLDANELVLKAHPDYHIELIFEQEADDDRVLTVIGNPYLLTTAFVNLIENNCKYSDNRTSFIQISFCDQWTIVSLSDNGAGMSETDKENLFKLFYRGENKNQAQGHGIGMTLTKKILTLHKSEISVYSHQGEGTTFVIRFHHL